MTARVDSLSADMASKAHLDAANRCGLDLRARVDLASTELPPPPQCAGGLCLRRTTVPRTQPMSRA